MDLGSESRRGRVGKGPRHGWTSEQSSELKNGMSVFWPSIGNNFLHSLGQEDPLCLCFWFSFIYLFIYFWLCWVFFFCCMQAFSSCDEHAAQASHVAEPQP